MGYTFAHFTDKQRAAQALSNMNGGTASPGGIDKDTIIFVGGEQIPDNPNDLKDGIYARGKFWGAGTGTSDEGQGEDSSFNLSDHVGYVTSGNNYGVRLSNGNLYVNVPSKQVDQAVEYDFEVAFAVVIATNTNPSKPVGVVTSSGKTINGVTWYPTGPNTVQEGYFTWMTTRTVVKGGNGTEEWSDPFIIGSAGSAGVDGIHGINGDRYEYIYTRTIATNGSGGYPNTPPKNISNADPSSKVSSKIYEDFIPLGWTDNPQGVSEDKPYEWISVRRGTYDENNNCTYSDFSTPALWSKYGKNGTDGDGFEYIFAVKDEGQSLTYYPNTWVVDDTFKYNSEYIPLVARGEWKDDPDPMTTPGQTTWFSVRKRYSDDGDRESAVAYWHAYSEPKRWAYYAKDGRDADDPTPTHPQNMVVGGDGINGEDVFNANKDSYLENIMIAVRDENGVIIFWAMKTSGVWNYIYAPNPATIPSSSSETLYGMDQWNASSKDKYTVYTIYDRQGGTIIGYGINGIFVSLPESETGIRVYETEYVNSEDWNPNNTNPNTIYYIQEEGEDGVYRTVAVYIGSIQISSGTEKVVAKSEFTEMFTKAIVVNKDDIAEQVWTVINVDDPEGGYLGTFKADLDGAISNIASVSTHVTELESRVGLLAKKVGDDGTIEARLDTVVEWDEATQSWKAKVLSNADEIIQQATDSITSNVVDNVTQEFTNENGEIYTAVTQRINTQIEQNAKGIFLSAFGNEQSGYKDLGQISVTSNNITFGSLKYNTESGEYEVDSDILFTMNLDNNKIVANADTFVISGDLIADAVNTNGLNVGNGNFVVDRNGVVTMNGATIQNSLVNKRIKTVRAETYTSENPSVYCFDENTLNLGYNVVMIYGTYNANKTFDVYLPPASTCVGASVEIYNMTTNPSNLTARTSQVSVFVQDDIDQGAAYVEYGTDQSKYYTNRFSIPFIYEDDKYGNFTSITMNNHNKITLIATECPKYWSYQTDTTYVWLLVEAQQ